MTRAHRDAVMAELRTRLPNAVFGSYSKAVGAKDAAGKSLQRWAVVFVGLGGKSQARFTGGQTRDTYIVTVHSVGLDEDLCLWVQERVNKLTDKVLTVPGRKLMPVEYKTGVPPDLDDKGTVPLWFTVSQFDIVSDPV